MDKIIKIKTAFPDVTVAYLNRGAASALEYLWMEKDNRFYGVSLAGLNYKKKRGEDPFETDSELDTAIKVITKTKEWVMKIFESVLLDETTKSFDLEEISSVIGAKRMAQIDAEIGKTGGEILHFENAIRQFAIQNKNVLDGVESLIFQAPSINCLFLPDPVRSLNDYPVALSNDMLAAIITEAPKRKEVFFTESMDLLRDKPLMEKIYAAQKCYELVLNHLDDHKWWGTMAQDILSAFQGKSSVRMILKGASDEIVFPGISFILTFPEKIFTGEGLLINYDMGSSFHFSLKYTKKVLTNNSILPYEKIDCFMYRNKTIWENPC